MWVSFIRGVAGMAALTFMMVVVTWILDPILEMANSGPNADHTVVQRLGGYFGALSQDNLILLAGLAVGVFLLTRAAVESNLGR